MVLNIIHLNDRLIAEVPKGEAAVTDTDEMLDILADAGQSGAQSVIIYEEQLPSGFFDLKTRIAGEILQKFSNYRMYLAVVGSFGNYPGKSLRDFIRESNRTGRTVFVGSKEEALKHFSGRKGQ